MKRVIAISLIFCASISLKAQNLVSLEHLGNSSFFQSIDSALFYAQNGDLIYVPGGTYTESPLLINKGVTLIGAGYNTDSSLATNISAINGNVIITSGADGGSLQGLYINGSVSFGHNSGDQTVNGFSFLRCKMGDLNLSFNGSTVTGTHNILVTECVILGNIGGGNAQNVEFSKCITTGMFNSFSGQVNVSNCIFLKNYCCDYFLNAVTGVNFSNNYIKETTYIFASVGNTFINNMFSHSNPPFGGSIASNNLTNVPLDSIFVNGSFTTYSQSANYQLRPGCVGKNAGTDGTDIGVYGTTEPFKQGGVPYNPHIRYKNISSITDGSGNLNVNIKVGAQQR